MTQDEEKELELFKKWWNLNHSRANYYDGLNYAYAKEAWFARAKLDKEINEKENL